MSQDQASQGQASQAPDMSQGQARQFEFDRRLEAANDFHRAAAGLDAQEATAEPTTSNAEALRRALAQMLADDLRHGVRRQCLSCEGDERCISCANLYGVELDLGPDYVPEESPVEERQYSRDSDESQESEPLTGAQFADHCYPETDDCEFSSGGGAGRVSGTAASQSSALEAGQNSVVKAAQSSAVKTVQTTSKISFGAWRRAMNLRERRGLLQRMATLSHASVPSGLGGDADRGGDTLLEKTALEAAQSSATKTAPSSSKEVAQSVEPMDDSEVDSQQTSPDTHWLRVERWKRARIADEAEDEL